MRGFGLTPPNPATQSIELRLIDDAGPRPLTASEYILVPSQRRIVIQSVAVGSDTLRLEGLRKEGAEVVARFLHLEPAPFQPKITGLVDLAGQPVSGGSSKGGGTVTLKGGNLSAVSRVLFGEKDAEIVAAGARDRIDVKVPSGANKSTVAVRAISRFQRDGREVASVERVTYRYEDQQAPAITKVDFLSLDIGQTKASVLVQTARLSLKADSKLRISAGPSASALAVAASTKPEINSGSQQIKIDVPTAGAARLVLKIERLDDKGNPAPGASATLASPARIPYVPAIAKIEGPGGGPTGAAAGEEAIKIHGSFLANVTKVLFGDEEAEIKGSPTMGLIEVVSPSGAAGKTTVRVESNLERSDVTPPLHDSIPFEYE